MTESEKWLTPSHLRLIAGEMTASEMRCVIAVITPLLLELDAARKDAEPTPSPAVQPAPQKPTASQIGEWCGVDEHSYTAAQEAIATLAYEAGQASQPVIATVSAELALKLLATLEALSGNDTYETEYEGQMVTVCHDCGRLEKGSHHPECLYLSADRLIAKHEISQYGSPELQEIILKKLQEKFDAEQPVIAAVQVWQPIETAPKDETEILVMYKYIETQVVHNGFYLAGEDVSPEDTGWWSYDKSEVSRIKLDEWMTPTHWMPLPSVTINRRGREQS